jgi:hypothetical protein
MAFDIKPRSAGHPEQTTVSGIHFSRLGRIPCVTFDYAETRVDRSSPLTVLGAVMNSEGVYIGLLVDPNNVPSLIAAPGSIVTHNDVEIGRVDTINATLEHVTLTLKTPLAEDPTGMVVRLTHTNTFGNAIHVAAELGHHWSNRVFADGAGFQRGAMMQISVATKLGMALVQQLGLSLTPAQMQAAVVALAMQGVTVEALMTLEAEALEIARRDGLAPEVIVLGNAP